MRLALILALAIAAPAFAQPVKVEETGKSPEPPPAPADLAYESRIRAAQASAQAFQGHLDGGWTIADAKGAELYVLQLVDKGRGDPVEGAWREAAGDEASRKRGLIDEARIEGQVLNLRFADRAATIRLTGAVWKGEIAEAGARRPVTMVKRKP